MEDGKYIVYICTDEAGSIINVNSSAFLADTAGWTAIDEGCGDKYHHAQGNYFPQPLYDVRGCANYKLENNIPVERSDEEKEAEIANRPAPMPSYNDRVAALEEAMLVMLSRGVSNV